MTAIFEIPEVAALDARRALVRIPPELDVPLTARVRQLIDYGRFPPAGADQPVGPGVAGLSGGHPHAVRALAWAFIGWRCCT